MSMDLPDEEKVDIAVVTKWCKHYKVKVDPSEDLSKAIAALSAKMSKSDIAGCDVCGGDSDQTLSECPFCGDGESEETIVTPEVKNMASSKKTGKKVAKKTEKKTAAKPNTRKPRPEKPAKLAAPKKEVIVVSSAALEKGMSRVRELQIEGIECMYELGKTIFNIFEKKLWTQMKTDDGKVVHDSWTTFCKKELGMAPQYSYRLMDVSTHFTKKQVADVGVSKLNLLVRVPEEKRKEMLANAKDTPRSKIAEEVAALAGNQRPANGRDGFKGERNTTGAKKNPAKKSEKLTVIRTEPRVVIDLFKRGTTDRAHELKDAIGIEECANGKKIHYAIMETDEGLSLVVETRQE